MKRLKAFWSGLREDIVVNKRELVMGVALCAAVGMLLGMLFSPRKQVAIGSHNCDNGCNNSTYPKA